MDIVLDFTSARRTAADDIAGVVARTGGIARRVVIGPDAVMDDDGRHDGVHVEIPDVCSHQAWLASVFLGGSSRATPIGNGEWDPDGRTMTWPLRSGRTRIMG